MTAKPMATFPDENQTKVIQHRGRPLVVIAGPGSGKTRTLVERAKVIIAEDPGCNVSFVTFTRTSRRDTRKKLETVLGEEDAKRTRDFPSVSTLHGFAKSIVHKAPSDGGLRPDFVVLVPDREQSLILDEVIQDLSLGLALADLRSAIACVKNTRMLPDINGITPEDLRSAVEHYLQLCQFYNAIDIEGLVNSATAIVEHEGIVLPLVYFHVDEYQDFNDSDQRFVQTLLSKGQREVVVVGDDDQSIYGGRHAKPEGIRELFRHSDWERVTFTRCHRLPPHILRASQALIGKHQGSRVDKKIEIPVDDGRRVPAFDCTTEKIEIELVADLIKKQVKEGESGGKLSFKNFMVLCPTKIICDRFAKALKDTFAIPTKKSAPKAIPEKLWRILLLLRLAINDDDVALRQWLDILGIPNDEIRKIRDLALSKRESLFDGARASSNPTLRQFMSEVDGLRSSRDDLDELLKRCKFLAGLSELPWETAATSVYGLISELYEEYGLHDADATDTETDEVLVTTLHSSKGLEAEIVFIVELTQRYMPNPSRDKDEELRLLYVGMTRAKNELYLLCSYVFDGRFKRPAPSQFLKAIEKELVIQTARRAAPKKKKAK